MGSAASSQITTTDSLSPFQIASVVEALGDEYQSYSKIFITKSVDGSILLSLDYASLIEFLTNLGISNKVHQKELIDQLYKYKSSLIESRNRTVSDDVSRKIAIAESMQQQRL